MGANYSKPEPIRDEKTYPRRVIEDGVSHASQVYIELKQSPPQYEERERAPSLTLQRIEDWNETLLGDAKNRLAISSLATQPYTNVLANHSALQFDRHIFNLKVPVEGSPITNQRSSGRCWLFASTNIFRVPLIKTYNLKDFELSQAYLFYWDKLEKSNWFFEQIISTADEDLSGRLVQKLFQDPVTDGGQWDMVANLVDKYGLVPHDVYPDAYHAQNSSKMNWLLTAKLREQALVLRRLVRGGGAGLAETKERFLREIHGLVTLLLGPPPSPDKEFVWQYYDADGKSKEIQLTPREFARQATTSTAARKATVTPSRMFSLVNDPRNEYNRLLTVDRLGNILEGRPLTYVNVEMKTLKNAVIAMLKAGHPVFFGCDVGKFSDSVGGTMDLDIVDLTLGFNISLGMSKAERLASGESSMTHAMVITGVHIEGDKPVRWRVENSWGEGAGDKGWFVMTDRWMDEYTFQAVVDSDFVSSEIRAILDQSPKVLPRWDPMGVLA
ncbi:cysteine protease [Aspergillus sclerotioniger CBS 115572]|uniref:Cysteine proteinase 1, mitochondrial n=1 Tax=Aspergillus sclerotioniger CBS 115572 TaxID=1450535 RepID=A0A317XDQ4_9EURO|nr:cysteine protease [Aspergillus sclerotioniger CBS 115572]PWY96669.1 cysteine protease [Aspergillus sclerotioniger CBS 115572]